MMTIKLFFVVGIQFVLSEPPTLYKHIIGLCQNIQNLECQLAPLDADEGITIIMGLSGSGKSTLANFASEQPMKYIRNFADYSMSLERINNTDPPCSFIGRGYSSQTSMACVLQNFVDMPGFDDNRGPMSEIRNSHIYNTFVKIDKPMRFVVCIPQYYLEPYQRAERLGILLSFLRPLLVLNSPIVFEKYVSVVITMATNTDPNVTKYHMSRILAEAPNMSVQAKQILSIWIGENFRHILYLERPTEVKDLLQPGDYHPVVEPAAPYAKNFRFGHHHSLSVCHFIQNVHSQFQSDLKDIFGDVLLQLQSAVDAMLVYSISASASDFRSILRYHWSVLDTLRTRTHQTDKYENRHEVSCCGDCNRGDHLHETGCAVDGTIPRSTIHRISLSRTIQALLQLFNPMSSHLIINNQIDSAGADRLVVALHEVCLACCSLEWLTQNSRELDMQIGGCLAHTPIDPLLLDQNEKFLALVKYLKLLSDEPVHSTHLSVPSITSVSLKREPKDQSIVVTIRGNIIGTSDVLYFLTALPPQVAVSSHALIIVKIFAKKVFVFDADLAIQGGSIALYSPLCLVRGNRTVQLSGATHDTPSCMHMRNDKGRSCGNDSKGSGVCGRPGMAGLGGGNFYCNCRNIHHHRPHQSIHESEDYGSSGVRMGQVSLDVSASDLKLTEQCAGDRSKRSSSSSDSLWVVVSGGPGGAGCPGREGIDGTPGTEGIRAVDEITGQLSGSRLVAVRNGIWAKTYVFRSGVCGARGEDGTPGGRGGAGGLPGTVEFDHFPTTDSLEQCGVRIVAGEGKSGMDGVCGHGGRGGIHLPMYEQHVYVTDKSVYNIALVGVYAILIGLMGKFNWIFLDTASTLSVAVGSRLLPIAAYPMLEGTWESMARTWEGRAGFFPLLSLTGVSLSTALFALKICILDRIATEDVQWKGHLAPLPYEVENTYYKAPDGRDGICCLDWPTGEGEAVSVAVSRNEMKVGDVILNEEEELFDNNEEMADN